MITPSQSEIQEAKAWTRNRVEAEMAMSAHIGHLLQKAAEMLIQAAYRNGFRTSFEKALQSKRMKAEIQRIIDWIVWNAETYTTTAATAEAETESEKEQIAQYISRKTYGKTLHQRLQEYATHFTKETLILTLAAIYAGMRNPKLTTTVTQDATQNPYHGQIATTITKQLEKAEKQIQKTETTTTTQQQTKASSAKDIKKLLRHAVSTGRMKLRMKRAKQKGAFGYMVFRGSSYPCETCDNQTNQLHFITNTESMPPLHLNCKCYIAFVYLT